MANNWLIYEFLCPELWSKAQIVEPLPVIRRLIIQFLSLSRPIPEHGLRSDGRSLRCPHRRSVYPGLSVTVAAFVCRRGRNSIGFGHTIAFGCCHGSGCGHFSLLSFWCEWSRGSGNRIYHQYFIGNHSTHIRTHFWSQHSFDLLWHGQGGCHWELWDWLVELPEPVVQSPLQVLDISIHLVWDQCLSSSANRFHHSNGQTVCNQQNKSLITESNPNLS